MNKKDLTFISTMILLYIVILAFFIPKVFSYRFDASLVEKYYHSQDIPHEVSDRIFLSDSEIHEAAGYLYATGADPTEYNFQHPPFIKYLYGASTVVFNNPYIAQIFLGILLLSSTYVLGKKLFNNALIAFIACLLLLVDPLFLDLSQSLLLDMGQAAFLICYVTLMLFLPKNWLLQGIALGILGTSKFWAISVFVIGIVSMYHFYNKKFSLTFFIKHIIVACVMFCLVYVRSFMLENGVFNIVFFQLKTLNYWLHHSVSSYFGASVVLFTTGFVSSWWGNKEIIRSSVWSAIWPLLLIPSLLNSYLLLKKKKINNTLLLSLIPILYLLYLGVQAPFPRYFIIILPFLYISAVSFVYNNWSSFKKKFIV